MKRQGLIIFLLVLSCAVYGYEPIRHTFPSSIDTYEASNTIAHMKDGTVYTCSGNARFVSYDETIALKLQQNGVVVVSPAVDRLREIYIYHNNGTKSLNVYTSINGSDWALQTTDSSVPNIVKVIGLEGDYQVKIENPNKDDVYLREVIYWIEPCHCLRVVSE